MKYLDGRRVSKIPMGEAGVGIRQCPDDFLVMAGTRICGQVLNDGTTDPKFTNNAPVTGECFKTFIMHVTTVILDIVYTA